MHARVSPRRLFGSRDCVWIKVRPMAALHPLRTCCNGCIQIGMAARRLILPLISVWSACLGVACSGAAQAPAIEKSFRSVVLRVPPSDEVTEALAGSDYAVISLCNLRPYPQGNIDGCRKVDPLISPVTGLRVIIYDPPTIWNGKPNPSFEFLRDRPFDEPPPPDTPLIPASPLKIRGREVRFPDVPGYESHALRRLQIFGGDPYLTTVHGWPIASCFYNEGRGGSCVIGFLSNGLYVEASNPLPDGRGVPSQHELWRLATDLDLKLRSWMLPRSP
jgi:hypothetical protein